MHVRIALLQEPSDNLGATQAGWRARPNPEFQLGNRERPITSSANSRYYRPMVELMMRPLRNGSRR
jgi:hypothetical protein